MYETQNTSPSPAEGKEHAIRNMGGLRWLYEKHASIFKTSYADSALKIRQLLQEHRSEDARTLAHSVKGLSGTLGYNQLYCAATRLEMAITGQDPLLKDAIDHFDQCLKEVVSGADKD